MKTEKIHLFRFAWIFSSTIFFLFACSQNVCDWENSENCQESTNSHKLSTDEKHKNSAKKLYYVPGALSILAHFSAPPKTVVAQEGKSILSIFSLKVEVQRTGSHFERPLTLKLAQAKQRELISPIPGDCQLSNLGYSYLNTLHKRGSLQLIGKTSRSTSVSCSEFFKKAASDGFVIHFKEVPLANSSSNIKSIVLNVFPKEELSSAK